MAWDFGTDAVLRLQIDVSRATGEMSQSLQLAPYDAYYYPFNASTDYQMYDTTITKWNSYRGGEFQQAVSALTYVPNNVYTNTSGDYNPYAMEWYANTNDRENGYIAWVANGVRSWTVHASAIRANPISEVGDRIIPEEPMYIILNFGMSNNFQSVTFNQLNFPNEMHIGESGSAARACDYELMVCVGRLYPRLHQGRLGHGRLQPGRLPDGGIHCRP